MSNLAEPINISVPLAPGENLEGVSPLTPKCVGPPNEEENYNRTIALLDANGDGTLERQEFDFLTNNNKFKEVDEI